MHKILMNLGEYEGYISLRILVSKHRGFSDLKFQDLYCGRHLYGHLGLNLSNNIRWIN